MGHRNASESIAAIYQALLRQRTWQEAELARAVGTTDPALRECLEELTSLGMPLESEGEPPHVCWSVPRSWCPGGAALTGDDAAAMVRVLWRLPPNPERDRLLATLLARSDDRASTASGRVTPHLDESEQAYLRHVENAAGTATALRIRYYSASRGEVAWRHVSVHRVLAGPPARFVATCHRSGELRWFRVDNIAGAALDADTETVSADEATIDDFVAKSANGLDEAEPAVEHVFAVRDPEARWVRRNLIQPMRVEPALGGIRVSAHTEGVLRIARFVVSLGDAARVETEELRQLVAHLAEGALRGVTASQKRPVKVVPSEPRQRAEGT